MPDPIRVTPLKKAPTKASLVNPLAKAMGSTVKLASANKHPWPIRPSKLLWLPVVGGIWLAFATYGTPHMRFQYNWTPLPGYSEVAPDRIRFSWCDYVGLHPRRVFPGSGRCPLVTLMLPEGEE